MTQIFDEQGSLIPVTVIEAGYRCSRKLLIMMDIILLQLGFGEKKIFSINH